MTYVNVPGSDYMWIGNEPNFNAPFLYNWTSQPYKSQAVVQRIRANQVTTEPDGSLPGNDDLGAESGWFVWSALGLYPEIPAVPGLTLTSPLFEKAVIWQGDKKLITITTDQPASTYVQSVNLNGKTYNSTWLPIDPVKENIRLEFKLGDKPSCWGGKSARKRSAAFFCA